MQHRSLDDVSPHEDQPSMTRSSGYEDIRLDEISKPPRPKTQPQPTGTKDSLDDTPDKSSASTAPEQIKCPPPRKRRPTSSMLPLADTDAQTTRRNTDARIPSVLISDEKDMLREVESSGSAYAVSLASQKPARPREGPNISDEKDTLHDVERRESAYAISLVSQKPARPTEGPNDLRSKRASVRKRSSFSDKEEVVMVTLGTPGKKNPSIQRAGQSPTSIDIPSKSMET